MSELAGHPPGTRVCPRTTQIQTVTEASAICHRRWPRPHAGGGPVIGLSARGIRSCDPGSELAWSWIWARTGMTAEFARSSCGWWVMTGSCCRRWRDLLPAIAGCSCRTWSKLPSVVSPTPERWLEPVRWWVRPPDRCTRVSSRGGPPISDHLARYRRVSGGAGTPCWGRLDLIWGGAFNSPEAAGLRGRASELSRWEARWMGAAAEVVRPSPRGGSASRAEMLERT